MALDIPGLISNLGFPIAITVYLLWERTKILEKLDDNTRVISELKGLIERLCTSLDKKMGFD